MVIILIIKIKYTKKIKIVTPLKKNRGLDPRGGQAIHCFLIVYCKRGGGNMSTKKAKAAAVIPESESAMDVVPPESTTKVATGHKKKEKAPSSSTGVTVTVDKAGNISYVIDKEMAIYKIPEIAIRRLTRRARIPRYGKNPSLGNNKKKKDDGKKKKEEPKLPRAIIQFMRHYLVDVTRAVYGGAGYVTDNGNRKTINDGDLQFSYRVIGLGDGKVAYGDQQNTKRPTRNKKGDIAAAEAVAPKLVKPTSTPKGIAATKVTKKKKVVTTDTSSPKKAAATKA